MDSMRRSRTGKASEAGEASLDLKVARNSSAAGLVPSRRGAGNWPMPDRHGQHTHPPEVRGGGPQALQAKRNGSALARGPSDTRTPPGGGVIVRSQASLLLPVAMNRKERRLALAYGP